MFCSSFFLCLFWVKTASRKRKQIHNWRWSNSCSIYLMLFLQTHNIWKKEKKKTQKYEWSNFASVVFLFDIIQFIKMIHNIWANTVSETKESKLFLLMTIRLIVSFRLLVPFLFDYRSSNNPFNSDQLKKGLMIFKWTSYYYKGME